MLINLDVKALEWFGVVVLSGDKVGAHEIRENIDQHTLNQTEFGLGEGDAGRLVAKKFVFRLIYGGKAPTYAKDGEFTHVSTDVDFWQEVIDKFYRKYYGIAEWHESIVEEVMKTGRLRIPTGRVFRFQQAEDLSWPRTQILNYPVQGFGADLMVLARVDLWNALKHDPEIKFVCTVHDSIVLDVPSSKVMRTIKTIYQVWKELPASYERVFKVPLTLPPRVEVSYGPDWKNQRKVAENEL